MKKYPIILADCPWKYDNERGSNPALGGKSYPTMTVEELKALDVQKIAEKDAALFMWATMPKLREALEVIEAWGFKYTTCAFVWVKINPKAKHSYSFTFKDGATDTIQGGIYSGMGSWTNQNVELCLFAKRGHPKRVAKNVKQIVIAPRGRHSAKPQEVRARIEKLMGDKPRVELFARETAAGWDALGNDIDGQDIKEILKRGRTEEPSTAQRRRRIQEGTRVSYEAHP